MQTDISVMLKDPECYKPGKIQLLLYSEVFFDLKRCGQMYVPNINLVLRNSAFGYLIRGTFEDFPNEKVSVHCELVYVNVEAQLKKKKRFKISWHLKEHQV